MSTPAQKSFIAQIDANKAALIQRLADAVAIPSVSGDAKYRKHVFEMADWLKAELEKLGCTAELKPLGMQTLDGQQVELPPVIFADYVTGGKGKKTILVYGVSSVQRASRGRRAYSSGSQNAGSAAPARRASTVL